MATAAPALPVPAPAPPPVSTQLPDAPVAVLDTSALMLLGQELSRRFTQFANDRQLTERKFIRNLRQYLGVYDPDVEAELPKGGSRAYPRITRVKCISMLSRIMNLMFPGNERNWELGASPSAEMNPKDVAQAVQELQERYQREGSQPPQMSYEFITEAVQYLAEKQAAELSKLIDDQLQEIGGDQTHDYISLNRKVVASGIQYGLGVLEGPYVKNEKKIYWGRNSEGIFYPAERTVRKPLYEFVSVWDYYPDLSAKSLATGDGYFIRKVMGRYQARKLADREDFFANEVKKALRMHPNGNYNAKEWETDLKTMGTKANVTEKQTTAHGKYEVIIWKGPVSGQQLKQIGIAVPEEMEADDIDCEIWMIGEYIIKAMVNQWRMMGCDVRTVHTFVFDEDDTSPIGNGLPNVMRDSQMSVCAATRMALDNASVVCGPNVEINTRLLAPGQDVTSIHAYKVWERDDDGLTQQYPAVREIKFDGHLNELAKLIEMFMAFADMETFIGPATGGDIQKVPSEPMRTAAGQSMLKGDAALPFKDIIRNFDFFTQSWILSLVHFNRKFNPHLAKDGDYDVIARGATSLIAKEVRGIQTDILAQTLTPEDRDWIDEEKFMRQRMATRDMEGLMLSEEAMQRKRSGRQAAMAEMQNLEKQKILAEIRETLSEAVKNVAQAAKNQAGADATTVTAALDVMEVGMNDGQPEGTSSSNSR